MAHEEFTRAVDYWRHWVIYFTVTFLSIFVFAEFALSVSLISLLSPSAFMFYFTPAGFFLGEAIVSLFASALLFLGLFFVLRRKVYVKSENSLEFNQSASYLMLPFYLVSLVSLGIYISLIPLAISNILTYAVFLILFESLIEHMHVSGYSIKLEIPLKIPERLKRLSPSKSKSTRNPEDIKKTLDELERITEVHEEKQLRKSVSNGSSIKDPEVQEMVKDLMGILEEGETGEEEIEEEPEEEPSEGPEKEATLVKECPNCDAIVVEEVDTCPDCGRSFEEEEVDKEKAIMDLTTIEGVGRTRAEKLYENGLYTAEDIVEEGITGLSGIHRIGIQTAKNILIAAEEQVEKEREIPDELTEELEDLERELLEDEEK